MARIEEINLTIVDVQIELNTYDENWDVIVIVVRVILTQTEIIDTLRKIFLTTWSTNFTNEHI